MYAKFVACFALCILTILIVSASQAFAAPTSTPGYVPPPAGNTVEITFDTNLPSTNTPISSGGIGDAPVGTYALILTVDGTQIGFVSNDGYFRGPVKLTWEAGSVHTYQWQSGQTSSKKFTWQSSSGLASDQSGTITATTSGSIIANYLVESASYQSGPSPAAPPPPDCGGKYFTSATSFPSGKCHHNQDLKRYFVFDFGGDQYYAVVESVWDDNGYGYYNLELISNEVVLSVSEGANYDLYVYDSDRILVGESHATYGQTDGVQLYQAPSPTPTPSPQIDNLSSKFDGRYQVTFSYTADYGGGPTAGQMVLYFDVKNGIVSHPQNIFSGNVYDDGTVDVTYSECSKFTNYSSPGSVTGSLSQSGYGDGTFSCGSAFYGSWTAQRVNQGYTSPPTPAPQPTPAPKPAPIPKPTPTPQPETEYKTYQNTEYGFSIKHPSWWQEKEILQEEPQGVIIAVFVPSKTTVLAVAFSEDDEVYGNLQGQDYLNQMIEDNKKDCKPPSCSNFKVGESNIYTHANGYLEYVILYSVSQKSDDGTVSDAVRIIGQIPNGKDTWVLMIQTTPQDLQQHMAEISSVTSTFTIFDYQEPETTPSPQPAPSPTKDSISISTDKPSYSIESTVSVHASIPSVGSGKNIAVSVTDPAGNSIVSRSVTTDVSGSADMQFKLPSGSKSGTYQVIASASIDGNNYQDSTQFAVSQATINLPEVSIVSIQATDQQGNPVLSFNRGATGFAKVVISAESNQAALVTINLFDSDLTSLGIGSFKTTLSSGESEIVLSFFIPSDAVKGSADIYANIFSDWPSRGGSPLTGESSTIVRIQ